MRHATAPEPASHCVFRPIDAIIFEISDRGVWSPGHRFDPRLAAEGRRTKPGSTRQLTARRVCTHDLHLPARGSGLAS